MPRIIRIRSPLAKHWCFTINNPKDEDDNIFDPDTMQYMILGIEKAPTTGTLHLQGYVALHSKKRLTGVRKLLPQCHLEVMRGTSDQAIAYCKKDGNWQEKGLKPMSNATRMKRTNLKHWADSIQHAKEGNFDLIPSNMLVRYYPHWKRIHQDNPIKPPDLDDLENIWVVAPTGYGKSKYVRDLYPGYYDKAPNKWFTGYKGEETIMCDDFGPKQCEYLGWYMKRWADLYSFPMETKGGGRQIRPKRVAVTSQYDIRDCWEDIKVVDAIERRFTTIHLERWQIRLLEEFNEQDRVKAQQQELETDEELDTETTVTYSSDEDIFSEPIQLDHMGNDIHLTDLFS